LYKACHYLNPPKILLNRTLYCPLWLQSLEGSINGLQAAQSDGLMRLNGGLQAAVADVTGALQEAVREETYRSLDPLRRLPELVQGALPVTPEVLVAPVDGGSVSGWLSKLCVVVCCVRLM
jgi:expansin (peptidoglycan-binding protein)